MNAKELGNAEGNLRTREGEVKNEMFNCIGKNATVLSLIRELNAEMAISLNYKS